MDESQILPANHWHFFHMYNPFSPKINPTIYPLFESIKKSTYLFQYFITQSNFQYNTFF